MIVTVEWVLVAVVAWCVVAVVVGLLVGRAVRIRDRQIPRTDPTPGLPRGPTPAEAPTAPAAERDTEGRGR